MPRKRRKLSKEMESNIASAKKKIEFVSAMINDIDDEDIQSDYKTAFERVILCFLKLSEEYDKNGILSEVPFWYENYTEFLAKFESEYEL